MNRETIVSAIKSYESQLAQAELSGDTNKIQWLKQQVAEGNVALMLTATYSD